MLDLFGSGALSIASFLIVISFVVVIHELGHYWAGRFFGVHAETFSIGFGPTLTSWRDSHGTLWRLAALPLGGYVRFRGDENAASAPNRDILEQLRSKHEEPDTVFHFKPVWQRAIIVAAGPFANFILAAALFAVLGAMRGELIIEARVGHVMADSAAAEAGFQTGDVITAMDGRPVDGFGDVQQYVFLRADQEIAFTVRRDDGTLTIRAAPRRTLREDGLGGERVMGLLGLQAASEAELRRRDVSLLHAPGYGVERVGETIAMMTDYFVRLLTGRASLEHVSGPVGILTTTGQVANQAVDAPAAAPDQGAMHRLANLAISLATLSALISVALGFMNLLPIPVLDGGHLVYYAYEAVAQKPPSPAVQDAGFRIGMLLILGMLLVATWNDLGYLRGLFS